MANRNFHRVQSLAREVKSLYGKVSIGASGAPTLSVNDSIGITSISRDSAGVYIVTLDDKYNAFLQVSIMMLEATAEDLTFQVESEAVATTKIIKFQCKAADAETDPSNGSVLLLKIDLKNTSVVR
jgi:hypothetical protein